MKIEICLTEYVCPDGSAFHLAQAMRVVGKRQLSVMGASHPTNDGKALVALTRRIIRKREELAECLRAVAAERQRRKQIGGQS